MLNTSRFAIWTVVAAACSGVDSPASGPGTPPASQGIVAGVVQDSAGYGVPNAVVCAATAFTASGTPTLVTNQALTTANGSYMVPINLTFKIDVRAGLTVAATPANGSGLAPAFQSGSTLLITTTPPPSETAHVNVVVPKGSPGNGVLCVFGP